MFFVEFDYFSYFFSIHIYQSFHFARANLDETFRNMINVFLTRRKSIMNVSERFLNYVQYGTQSDITSSTVPSTKGQLVLAARLADEAEKLSVLLTPHTDEKRLCIRPYSGCKGLHRRLSGTHCAYGHCHGPCPVTITNHASSAIMTEMTWSLK